MRAFRGRVVSSPGNNWQQSITLPSNAVADTQAVPCLQVTMDVVGPATGTVEDTMVLAASDSPGVDVVWTLLTEWEGEPDTEEEPTITPITPTVWSVEGGGVGILVVTPTYVCAGSSFSLPPITLVRIAVDTYTAPVECDPPVDWTPIQALSGVLASYVRPDYSEDAEFFYGDGVYWNGSSTGAISFTGLAELFCDVDMEVRVTVVVTTLDSVYDEYVDRMTNPVDTDTDTYTVLAVDIATYFTGCGINDGSGGLGGAQWKVEVRALP